MVGAFFVCKKQECEVMAYQGYLVKVGNYKIPSRYIKAESYSITKNGQDLDSYRDADGKLHRTALSHFVWKIEFETPPLLTDEEMTDFLGNIQRNYTDKTEKKSHVTFYDTESNSYKEQDMYMPDIQFSIYGIFNEVIKYNSTRIAFIGY